MAGRILDLTLKSVFVATFALIGYAMPTANALQSAVGGAVLAITALVISAPMRARSAAREKSQSRSTNVGLRVAFFGVLCMFLGLLLSYSISFPLGFAAGILGFGAVISGIAISRFQLLDSK